MSGPCGGKQQLETQAYFFQVWGAVGGLHFRLRFLYLHQVGTELEIREGWSGPSPGSESVTVCMARNGTTISTKWPDDARRCL